MLASRLGGDAQSQWVTMAIPTGSIQAYSRVLSLASRSPGSPVVVWKILPLLSGRDQCRGLQRVLATTKSLLCTHFSAHGAMFKLEAPELRNETFWIRTLKKRSILGEISADALDTCQKDVQQRIVKTLRTLDR